MFFCHFLRISSFSVKFDIKKWILWLISIPEMYTFIYITVMVWKLQHLICFTKFWVHTPLKGNKYVCCSRTQTQSSDIMSSAPSTEPHLSYRNTNASTPTPNLGESHWHGVCRCLPYKVFFFFSKFGIAISTVEPWRLKSILLNYQVKKKKDVVLSSATDPSPKIKLKEIRVRNVPNFCQIGCFFSPFLSKKVENAPNFCTLGAFFKIIFL